MAEKSHSLEITDYKPRHKEESHLMQVLRRFRITENNNGSCVVHVNDYSQDTIARDDEQPNKTDNAARQSEMKPCPPASQKTWDGPHEVQ